MTICLIRVFSADLAGKAQHDTGNRIDSLLVITLHKKAYLCRLEDPERTLKLGDSALRIAERINYKYGIAEAYRIKGIGFSYLNNISLSVSNYLNALHYYRELNDRRNEARIYSNIGTLYKSGDPEKAIEFFDTALKISRELKDQELLAGLYFSMAGIYMQRSEFKRSLHFFEKSLEIFSLRNDTTHILMSLQGTGRAYFHLNNLEEAKSRLLKAIGQAERHKVYSVLADCYLTFSYLYIQQGQFNLAKRSIEKGMEYSMKFKDPKRYNYFIQAFVQLESRNKDFEKALHHLTVIYKYDSTLLSRFWSENIGITSRHFFQQQKIQESEFTITRQKYREAVFRCIITIIIIIFLVMLVVYIIREKRRRKRELIIQNNITELEQKALQAMMNPHFVFNAMNSIQHFLNKSDSVTANRILARFARLARKHLEICMKSRITLREEIIYLRFYLSLEKIRFSNRMDFKITVSSDVDAEDILIPSMLIQPFIENAIWHGLMPKGDDGYININFELEEEELVISIVDNGIGLLNSEKLKKQNYISRGMSLIRERVSLLNKLNSRSIFIFQQQTGDSGTEVLIRIPA